MLPDFIIVGAMKSGTSTLADYLTQHSDIYMPDEEVHFFYEQSRGNWKKGVQWYKRQFSEASSEHVIGEKTPTYSYITGIEERIHDVIPDVKLVWIFRDPVDRAYSNYWHAVCAGNESRSFAQAVRQENEHTKRNPWKNYVRRSVYVEQVSRYLDYFDQEQMHFCLFENLKDDRNAVLEELLDFIGVDEHNTIQGLEDVKSNVTYIPLSVWVRYGVRSVFNKGSLIGRVEHRLNRKREPGYPNMDMELRSSLKEYFSCHNTRLEKLTGLDLSAWRS